MAGRIARCSPFVLIGIFLLVRPAYGYIDPGTYSLMWQTLLGILFAVAYTLKIYWRHVAGFFRYRFSRKRRGEESEK